MAPPADTPPAAGQGWRPDLRRSVVRILGSSGQVAGTGFVVGDRLVVTCAHAVSDGAAPPDRPVSVEIPREATPVHQAHVDAASWRPRDGDDVALLRCDNSFPDSVRPLPLGTSADTHGHRVASFGFPANAPRDGHYGYGRVGDEILGDAGSRLIQVTECSEMTEGFSGAPVLDEVTGLVIGIVDSVATVDRLGRGGTTAYVTPTETLRSIRPDLTLSTVCPYMGLEAFSSEHAEWFFGRKRAVDAVLARLRQDVRMVALLGPSGSGKSSLINAGVVPALGRGGLPGSEQWEAVTVVPAELPDEPLITMAAKARHEGRRRVVVLDQFEQLLATGDRERRAAVLAELAELPDLAPDVTVILVMRDDFYSRLAAAAPPLMRRLEHAVVNVPAVLERDELAAIITGPAEAAGLSMEPQLAERIVSDAVAAAPPDSPGVAGAATTALPLVEFTLTELWRRRVDGRLTHAAYESLGGVTGGLADWCERTYQSLPPRQRQVAERILTALIEPADETAGTSPVSRRRTVTELHTIAATDTPAQAGLTPEPTPREDVDEVLGRLADARLVVTRHDPDAGVATAELSHDALIREWARLREWLERDRDFLSWHAWAEDQSARWRSTGDTTADRDTDLLLRGSALELAVGWCESRRVRDDVREFVEQSSGAEQRWRTRARRRVQLLTGLLVVAVTLGVLAAVFAYRADESAERAEQQARIATSRALAVAADATLADQPDLAHLLALESLRAARTDEALTTLGSALSEPLPVSVPLTGHEGLALGVAFSQDGDVVATIGVDRTMRLWDRDTGEPVGEPVTYVDPQTQAPGDADLARGLGFTQVDEPLTGGASFVHGAALSPDGGLLATTRDDGTVLLRDTTSGEPIGDPLRHDVTVNDVTFSPDGDLLATAGDDGTILLWDTATRDQVGEPIRHDASIEMLAFGPGGDLLATADANDAVRLWDAAGEQVGRPIRHDTGITDLAYGPDGDLATLDEGNTVRLWNPTTGNQVGPPIPHDFAVYGIAFSPDGNLLASATFGDAVQLWSTAAEQPVGTALPQGENALAVAIAFGPDGDVLATTSDVDARIWDLSTAQQLGYPLPNDEPFPEVTLSPDGHLLTTFAEDGALRLWDTATGEPIGNPLRHDRAIYSQAFSPGSDLLATAGDDGTVRLWDTATGEPIGDPLRHDDAVLDVAFSPDGDLLASGGGDRTLRLWNPATGEPVGDPLRHGGAVQSVAFSPDGEILAASVTADETVRLWDPATGDPIGDPLRHGAAVAWVTFSPDGELLATASTDGTVRLWSTAADRPPGTLLPHDEGIHDVEFSPDGELIATAGDDGTIRLWDTATGDQLEHALRHDDAVYSVAFSPDGDLLASGSADETVRLWDPATGEQVGDPFAGHDEPVSKVRFSPDGDQLATAGLSTTVRLWATPETWIQHACRRAGRNLSQEEWETYLGEAQYVRTCPEFPAGPGADTDAPTADYSALPDIYLQD